MKKKIGLMLMMVFLLPVFAYAAPWWSLNTWVRVQGGSISVNGGAPQTSANGSVYKYFNPDQTAEIKITPLVGHSVRQVTVNKVTTLNPTQTVYNLSGPNAQSFSIYFMANPLTTTFSAGPGGRVSSSTYNTYYGSNVYRALNFRFTPNDSTSMVDTITGVPEGATITPAKPYLPGRTVTVTFPVGFVFKENYAISGTFAGPPVAKAGLPQVVKTGTLVTLDGSQSLYNAGPIDSYTWTQVSGPSFVQLSGNGAQVTFTPDAIGVYRFYLKVTGGSFTSTTVTSTNNFVQTMRTDCQVCHLAAGHQSAVPVFNSWSSSKHAGEGVYCAKCHIGVDGGGHPGPVMDKNTFKFVAYSQKIGAIVCEQCHSTQIAKDFSGSKHESRAGVNSCTFCHSQGAHNPKAKVCIDCHKENNEYGIVWPITREGLLFHENPMLAADCALCHNNHSSIATNCDICHDSPPKTASHAKHFSGTNAQSVYGDTRITQDFSNGSNKYIIGCGNCHPTNQALHYNGIVEVELYNPQASGTVKSLNPPNAQYAAGPNAYNTRGYIPYTDGTCSNVYCHSSNEFTTNSEILPNDVNWKDKVVTTRVYKDVVWGGPALGCNGCHNNPPQTAAPGNDGGAGDSHSWIDANGNGTLHNFNKGTDPVSCSYCHNDTVKVKNTFTRDTQNITTMSDVPISNFSKHVNGKNDVAFDKNNAFVYYSSTKHVSMSLNGASYVPATKTCANVSCHQNETSVQWGTPYRANVDTCNRCHTTP